MPLQLTPYGARGANGVIVIKTKRGSDRGDKLTIELKSGTKTKVLI